MLVSFSVEVVSHVDLQVLLVSWDDIVVHGMDVVGFGLQVLDGSHCWIIEGVFVELLEFSVLFVVVSVPRVSGRSLLGEAISVAYWQWSHHWGRDLIGLLLEVGGFFGVLFSEVNGRLLSLFPVGSVLGLINLDSLSSCFHYFLVVSSCLSHMPYGSLLYFSLFSNDLLVHLILLRCIESILL
jgi:hypothetical protein